MNFVESLRNLRPDSYISFDSCAFICDFFLLLRGLTDALDGVSEERNGDMKVQDSEPPTPLSVAKMGSRYITFMLCYTLST
ncbi:hypothetical protein L484_020131 [Morus notabilis]|uniref:Uncharacterized protein n=1 Tax=Morus notabilis TaxID=981085 RepID=W9RBG8_9ROSA|nr:hypothetical protein L484_020131 [Morus notabilis]